MNALWESKVVVIKMGAMAWPPSLFREYELEIALIARELLCVFGSVTVLRIQQ